MAVKGELIEKPLTTNDISCKRKHMIRNNVKKLQHSRKKHAKKSKNVN